MNSHWHSPTTRVLEYQITKGCNLLQIIDNKEEQFGRTSNQKLLTLWNLDQSQEQSVLLYYYI